MKKDLKERIEERAYEIFLKNETKNGYPINDWLKAEKEIMKEEKKKQKKKSKKV